MANASRRNIPRTLSSPNAAASHTSPNKQIKLWLSPDKPTVGSLGGMRVENMSGHKMQDSEKQLRSEQLTPTMLARFRTGWHDRALSSSNWRVRVGN